MGVFTLFLLLHLVCYLNAVAGFCLDQMGVVMLLYFKHSQTLSHCPQALAAHMATQTETPAQGTITNVVLSPGPALQDLTPGPEFSCRLRREKGRIS